jgi:HSP20 family protein
MNRGIMRWHPMHEIDRFFDDDLMSGADFVPALDVYQEGDNVIAKVSLPDIDPENVHVAVENDVLTISGERKEQEEVKREDFYKKEIREGSFSRSVVLPMPVKATDTKAVYEKGMLKVTLPKAEEAKPKRIDIEVSGK